MHEQWQPVKTPPKPTFQELTQPARASRRAAAERRRVSRRARSRLLLILVCVPLIIGSAVGGYFVTGRLRDHPSSRDTPANNGVSPASSSNPRETATP